MSMLLLVFDNGFMFEYIGIYSGLSSLITDLKQIINKDLKHFNILTENNPDGITIEEAIDKIIHNIDDEYYVHDIKFKG